MKGLSKQTFECLIRSCNALISLVSYLFGRYPSLQYILPGNITSDFLERRFGWYRQLCGGNYYNAVVQFLQAEKTILLRSLVDIGDKMDEVKQIFKDSLEKKSALQKEEIRSFISNLSHFRFTDDSVLSDSDKSIIYRRIPLISPPRL